MRYIARSDPIRAIGLLILAIAIVVAIALSLHSSNATGQSPWRLAKEGAPTGLMEQVIQENIQPGTPVEAGQMKVWTIQQPHQASPLYLIDTRVANAAEHPQDNPLCGAQGCVFLAYIPAEKGHYQRALSIYLNPHLPPKMTLLQPTAELKARLPCLVARQLEQQKIRVTQFCFNGSTYEIVETQRLPEVYE
jgi:hypothetical protein